MRKYLNSAAELFELLDTQALFATGVPVQNHIFQKVSIEHLKKIKPSINL